MFNNGNQPNIMAMFRQFMNDPQGVTGLGVPQEMKNDPNAIISCLMSSGKMNQQQYNQLRAMAENIMRGLR